MKKRGKQISKKKVQKKQPSSKKIQEEIKKLKVKIPEPKKAEEKNDSKLEEQIEQTEEVIEDTEFHEFFRPSERNFTSLLNKIETPAENLEENVALTPIKQEDKTLNLQSYSPDENYARGEAKKYQTENTSVSLRRIETSQELPRQELRNQFQAQRDVSWNNWNQQVDVQAIENERELPFERHDKKYKEFRPH
jgi:hypothetical protein